MKSKLKLVLAVAMALLMTASVLGCSLVSVNDQKDKAQIVAKVGEKEITKGEFVNQFDFNLNMLKSFGYDPTTTEDGLNQFQDSILDGMIEVEMMSYQAKKQGFVQLDEEQQKDAEEQAAQYDQVIYEAAVAQAQQELGQEAGANVDARALEIYPDLTTQYFAQYGYVRLTRDQMKDWVVLQLCINNMRTAFDEKVTVTDDEVKAAYDTKLASDKDEIGKDAGLYKDRQESFERSGGTPPLFAPEGYVRVKQVLFVPADEIDPKYEENKTTINDKQEEIRDLKLQDETANADKITALQAEIDQLTAANDQIYMDHYAKSKADAEAAYQRLQSGESFDTVMQTNADPDFGADGVAAFKEKGKLLSKNASSSDWSDAIKNAVLALTTPGSYTGVIKDDAGFHIVQFVAAEPTGERSFEEVKQSIHDETLTTKQDDEWTAMVDEWLKDTTVVTRYPDLIRDVGA